MGQSYSVEAYLKATDQGFTKVFAQAEATMSRFSKHANKFAEASFNGLEKAGSGMTKFVTTPVVTGAIASIKSFGNLEQAIGGVETMFKQNGSSVQALARDYGITREEAKKMYDTMANDGANVIENANKAYMTAGVSATSYMEQVTSFSASLLQGLGGDTVAAAKYADMAILDMADNANKFGTSIGDIQNAYQGFAKDNYTMLDNLKLGYGGTAGEMARLVNESGVLNGEFEATAENVKDIPFDKLIQAIHVTQKKLGVTGTTAKEASQTVNGSFFQMRAAAENLVAGLGNAEADTKLLMSNLWESVKIFGDNIKRVLGTMWENLPISSLQKYVALAGVTIGPLMLATGKLGNASLKTTKLVNGAMKSASNGLSSGLSKMQGALPGTLSKLIGFGSKTKDVFETLRIHGMYAMDGVRNKVPLLGRAFDGIGNRLGLVVSGIKGHLINMGTAIAGWSGKFSVITNAVNKVSGVFSGSFGMMSNVLGSFAKMAMMSLAPAALFGVFLAGLGLLNQQFGTQISQMVNVAVTQGPAIITNFINGIVSRIPEFINQGTQLIEQFTQVIVANAPAVFQGAVALIQALVQGVGNNASRLIASAVQIVGSLVSGLMSAIPQLLTTGMQFLVQLVQGIVNNIPLILSTAQTIFVNFVNSIVQNLPTIIQAGIQIIVSLVQGLIQNLPTIIDTAVAMIGALLNGLAQALPQMSIAGFQLVVQLVTAIITGLPSIIQAGVELITGLGSAMLEAIPAALGAVWDGIKNGFDAVWGWVTGKNSEGAANTSAKITETATTVETTTANMATNVSANMQTLADGVNVNMSAANLNANTQALQMLTGVTGQTSAMALTATNDTLALAMGVNDNLATASANATTQAETMAAGVNNAASTMNFDAVNHTLSLAQGVGSNMTTASTNAQAQAQALNSGVSGQLSSLNASSQGAMSGLSNNVTSQMNAATNSAVSSANKMSSAVTNSFNQMKTSANSAVSGLASSVTSGMNKMTSTVTSGANKMQQTFNQMFNRVKSQTNSAMNSLQSSFQSGMSRAVNIAQQSGNQIISIFRNLQGQMSSAGAYAGIGFANGLAGTAGHIYAVANSIANNVAATIRRALDIHSPSRVTYGLGSFTGEGMYLGMESWVGKIGKVAGFLAEAAVPEMEPIDLSARLRNITSSAVFDGGVEVTHKQQPMKVMLTMGSATYRAFTEDITRTQEMELILNEY